jgi:hypothetical protein
MTAALAQWVPRQATHTDAASATAVAVIPAIGSLPPLVVRTGPRRLASRSQH